MSTSKRLDRVCVAALVLALLIAALAFCAPALGFEAGYGGVTLGYETRLFDTTTVHTIDIVMDDWEGFIDGCEDEEYVMCSLIIDGEEQPGAGIRAKGNTSLSSVAAYGNDRYSFKVEFDHYDSSLSYYGLDKLNLNNIIQDNTYMKDYLSYRLMAAAGAAARPVQLCLDNSERRGLGPLPGGGGRGEMGEMPGRGEGGEFTMPEEGGFGADRGGMMGSDDVYLIYTDDDPESYPNIFDNAKTDVSASDEERLIAALKALNEGGDVSDCVDVEAVIRYFVAHNFVCNFDSYTGSMVHNYYLYEEDGILSMLPWDYNLAFGGFMSGSDATSLVNWDIDEPVSGGTVESRPMLAWIFESEEYTELYHEIFAEFIDSVFTSGWFEELMDETVSLIAPYVELDPTKFCTYEEFELGVETLREFCLLRAESITYQLAGEDVTVDAGALDVSDMGSMNMGG